MTIAIVGRTGSGKTFAAKGLIEPDLAAGARVCVIDPTGAWWGLRLSADGSAAAFPVVIFGGDHGDVPIDATQGDRLADMIVEGRVAQCVVDVSEMSSGEQTRFLTDLFERLYTRNKAPLTLVMDEADLVAPQQGMPEQMRLKGATNKIVRRGRIKGFRPIMITQRPAVLDKSVLSQIDTLIAMRLTSPQDRKAIEEWVKGNADEGQARAVLDSLASLPRGEGWFWAPADDKLERRQFPPISTFDSSRTPEHGEETREVAPLSLADMDELRAALAPTEKAAAKYNQKNNSPDDAALREEIARLGGQVTRLINDVAAAEARGYARGVSASIGVVRTHLDWWAGQQKDEGPHEAAPPTSEPVRKIDSAAASPPPKRQGTNGAHAGDTALTGPQRQFLKALAWWAAMGHPTPSRAQVAAIAGWRVTSGHLKNVAGSLSSAGLIEYPAPGLFTLMPAGERAAPAPDLAATLHDSLRSTFTGPQRVAFDALASFGRATTRDALAKRCGWEPTSGHVKNVLGSLSTLEVIEYPRPGEVALQGWVRG